MDGIERQLKDEEDAKRELEIRTAQVKEARTMIRDPRVDPRPGDVVLVNGGTSREVVRVSPASVWYTVTGRTLWMVRLLVWRRECTKGVYDAEIVKVADE